MWPGITPAKKKRVLIRQSIPGPAIWWVLKWGPGLGLGLGEGWKGGRVEGWR
jgi:hypothetical protein